MTAYDLRRDGSVNSAGTYVDPTSVSARNSRVSVVERKVSCSTSNYNTGTTNSGYMLNSVGAGDTVKIMDIPAGCLVLDVRLEVLVLGVGNLSVGDSGSGTQYMAATSIASTGFKTMVATPNAKFYAAVDYILLTYASANDGVTAGQTPSVKVTVTYIDNTDKPPATTAVL